jgi:hypothetical protein
MKRVLLAVVLLGVSSVSLGAEIFMSGNELLAYASECDKYRDGDENKDYYRSCGSGRAYVAGISDMYSFLNSRWLIEQHFCKPDAVDRNELVVTVRKYMAKHPEEMDSSASGIIYDALVEAYPCE